MSNSGKSNDVSQNSDTGETMAPPVKVEIYNNTAVIEYFKTCEVTKLMNNLSLESSDAEVKTGIASLNILINEVNEVYGEQDGEFFSSEYKRTSLPLIRDHILKRELIVATLGNEIAGCVVLPTHFCEFCFKIIC